MKNLPRLWLYLTFYARIIFLIAYPLLLCPILILDGGEVAKGLYTFLLMAGLWVTGVIPIYVTALLPLVMGPLMGLVTSSQISKEYMGNTSMLFFGSIMLATAAEQTALPRRISIGFLRLMGHDPKLLILGIMIPTWFLSMWMSNTASTIIMLTITEAILTRLQTIVTGPETTPLDEAIDQEDLNFVERKRKERFRQFASGLSLSVCYASSCGGIATLLGSPTNLIFYGLITDYYGSSTPMNFGYFSAYSLPVSILCLLTAWLLICLFFLNRSCGEVSSKISGSQSGHPAGDVTRDADIVDAAIKVLAEEQTAIGPFQFDEGVVIGVFCLVIMLWISRNPGLSGWLRIMPSIKTSSGQVIFMVTDTQPTIFCSILLFILPRQNPFKLRTLSDTEILERLSEPILTWKAVEESRCWGVIILMGGGFALSTIIMNSGLSDVIATHLAELQSIPTNLLTAIISFIAILVTEFVSNAATVSILVPILFGLATSTKMHPFLLALPLTMAASCAFAFPAATPPNAIVFAKGRVRFLEMVCVGLVLNAASLIVIIGCTLTYAVPLFGLNNFPDWANLTRTG